MLTRYKCTGLLLLLIAGNASALNLQGNVAAEARLYPEDAQFPAQQDDSLTFSFQPKLSHDWNGRNDELVVELFLRADSDNENREHADIREFKWLHVDGANEWRIGIDTVFWGVTESQHLVDVINSIDRVEGFDGEDKLGQPMVHYTTLQDWGVFHVFVLPGFRESEFNSLEGRLRPGLEIDADRALFESSDEEDHVDVALRYAHFIGDIEFGLSLFQGTSRDPQFVTAIGNSGQPILVPFYAQMTQFGLDLQAIVEDWLWKWELIYRDQDDINFSATTFGFEYTFYGIAESAVDLGVLAEYSYDTRDESEAGVFNNDLFAGARFAFNDVQSSEILAGVIVDADNQSRTFRAEASRRLGESWKLTGELQVFSNIDANDPLKSFEQDDFLLLELARYF
jgi:hypothetical protein